MQLRIATLAICLILLLNQANSFYVSDIEERARNFVQQTSSVVFYYLNGIKYINYPSDYGFLEGHDRARSVYREMVKRLSDLAKQARSFPRNEIRDGRLRSELDILSNIGVYALEDDYFDKLQPTLETLQDLSTQEILCSYRHREYCELSYANDVKRYIMQSHDAHALQYYWEEWRNKISPTAKDNLRKFVDIFKDAAHRNGKTAIDLWFYEYEDPNFLADMEDVMKQLKPFYTTFHAYVRHVLHKKYGELVVSPNGPIPHHLIEQILAQAWKKNSLLEPPYPEKKLPNYKEQLDQQGFHSFKIVQLADDYFKSMGFTPLPSSFWSNYTKSKSREDPGVECKSEVFDLTPDIALKYCPRSNFKKFLQIHGDMARLHYANQKKDLPSYYFDSYQFEYGVGEATILAASTPKHVQRIGLLQSYVFDEQLSMNRLFRFGIHTIFQLPIHFVQSKIMTEILSEQIPFEQINKRYWQLMEEYAGIEPPSDRKLDNIDFSYKFYEKINENHQTRKFSNEILGYQFYRALCKISGGYIRGNPNQPLQNCDFYGSYEAGEKLRQMMSQGSKNPWKDVLAVLVDDEPDLNAAALLEFYEPLRNWLESQNNLNNVVTGWVPSTKQVK